MNILGRVKREVDFDNPLYKTGILIDREALRKARELLGSRFELETDSDLFDLVAERGDEVVEELRETAGRG